MRSSIKHASLAALLLAAGIGPAQAASYYLDQSNSNAWVDGQNYLVVTFTAVGDDIQVAVDALTPPFTSPGIQAFAFNLNGVSGLVEGNISGLPTGWKFFTNQNADGFGRFDIALDGTGGSLSDPLAFTITGVDGDSPESYGAPSEGEAGQKVNPWFAAQVKEGAWFAGGNGAIPPSMVPVPGAVWLFGTALTGVAVFARRESKKAV